MIKTNARWIYTYDYAEDSRWDPWRTTSLPADWIDRECISVGKRVMKVYEENQLKFALLSDSHYVINGTWEDTAYSLQELCNHLMLNGVIHLGDLTDGVLSARETRKLEDIVKRDLESLKVPIYITPGNHDYNYFKGNPDLIYPERPQYYIDYPEQKLRMIFIDSFDPREQLRYGFTDYCIHWLDSIMRNMQDSYCAIIFSHVAPLVRLQVWANDIRNREKLMDVLNRYADNILAFINGHNHCDHLFNDLYNGKFPVISINCSKCEYFLEHKPEGAVVPYRELGTRTQESFDIMTVDTYKREIYFTRFGAGRDRVVKGGKARWIN